MRVCLAVWFDKDGRQSQKHLRASCRRRPHLKHTRMEARAFLQIFLPRPCHRNPARDVLGFSPLDAASSTQNPVPPPLCLCRAQLKFPRRLSCEVAYWLFLTCSKETIRRSPCLTTISLYLPPLLSSRSPTSSSPSALPLRKHPPQQDPRQPPLRPTPLPPPLLLPLRPLLLRPLPHQRLRPPSPASAPRSAIIPPPAPHKNISLNPPILNTQPQAQCTVPSCRRFFL